MDLGNHHENTHSMFCTHYFFVVVVSGPSQDVTTTTHHYNSAKIIKPLGKERIKVAALSRSFWVVYRMYEAKNFHENSAINDTSIRSFLHR